MTTIVIADDHEIVRQGLQALLETQGCRVLAAVADGLAAAQAVDRFKPTLLFLDLNMPRLHGLEVLKQARTSSPHTRVIVYSMHNDEPYVIEALRAGAAAYLLKGSASNEIQLAVTQVLAGHRYLSAPLSERAIRALTTRVADTSDPLEKLSPREREVLQHAVEGCGNQEIAERLFISPRTAETHRTNLLHKLGLQSQTDLVRFAIRKGLITA